MTDIFKILIAIVAGYSVFVLSFYLLTKLIFSKIETDEEQDQSAIAYKKLRAKRSMMIKKFDPYAFKINTTRHSQFDAA